MYLIGGSGGVSEVFEPYINVPAPHFLMLVHPFPPLSWSLLQIKLTEKIHFASKKVQKTIKIRMNIKQM